MLMDLYDIFYKNIELFGDGGKVYGKLTTTSFYAHTASLRLALICSGFGCYFFLVQERSNQESEPGRSFRGLPFRAALQGETREITYTLFMLCLNFRHHARQALKAKTFALKCVRVSLTRAHKR
jgi:hypothetical protein